MLGVIMAGGFGTRLRPVTCNIPKPMVPVANRPMMEHVVEVLTKTGIKDQVSLLFYQPESIMNHFGDGKSHGISMRYARAMSDLGTAGAVRFAAGEFKDTFVVISGDVVTDFDLSKAIEFHKKKKAKVTVCLTRVSNPLAFGIVITDKTGKIVKFLEKPSWGEVFSDTINTGIYIMEPDILEMIPPETSYDFSKDLFPKLLAGNIPLYGYIAEGYWKDVGNVVEYRKVHQDIISGRVKLRIAEKKMDTIGFDLWVGEGSKIHDKLMVSGGVIIGKNCKIGQARLRNCVIGDNCTVDDGAEITNSVIWSDTTIGRGATIIDNIVGTKVHVGHHAFSAEDVIISDYCRVGDNASIRANIKMWPHKVVETGATLAHSLIWGEKWNKELFETSGISGLANIEITPEFAAKIGATFGATIGKGHCVVTSRDDHKACRLINRALISGFLSVGVDVHDLQAIPSPVTRYQIAQHTEIAGIHTRRSPYDHDRLQLLFIGDDGCDLPLAKQQAIERLFFREDFARANVDETGDLAFPHRVLDFYKEGVFSFLDVDAIQKARLKVVIDYSSGNASTIFPSILGSFNCDVVGLNAYVDSNKLVRTPEEMAEAMQQLSFIVRSLKKDFGIIFDVNAEKIGLVDETGHILTHEECLGLMCLLQFSTNKGAEIALPVDITRNMEKLAAQMGGKIIRTKTGGPSLMRVAKNRELAMAACGTGGFIFPGFQAFFDGIVTTAKLLEMMAKTRETPISELLKKLPKSTLEKRDIPCSFEMKGTIMRKLLEEVKDEKVSTIDGITIEYSNGWVLLIPDADRPFFRITAEFSTRKKSQEHCDKWTEKIQEWQAEG